MKMHPALQFPKKNYTAIGWHAVGDLSKLQADRERSSVMNSVLLGRQEKHFCGRVILVLLLFVGLVNQPPICCFGGEPVMPAPSVTNRLPPVARMDKLGPLTVSVRNPSNPTVMAPQVAEQLIFGLRRTQKDNGRGIMSAAQLETTRGADLSKVYRNAAPSVVLIVVAGGDGHGSGFLVSPDGWLVTNHHVAKEATLSDRLTREAIVHLGRLNKDGYMEPIQEQFTAEVFKWDQKRDLALLRLVPNPSDSTLPHLTISDANIQVGDDVVSIGHAALSLMWSIKPGVVQAVGKYVLDSAAIFRTWDQKLKAATLGSTGLAYDDIRRAVESKLTQYGDILVIQSTSPILPGDSGGPLLNLNGEVVGVNAFCGFEETGGRANYFIHAKELKAFLEDKPQEPMQDLPTVWDVEADSCGVYDLDGDGKPETMLLYKISLADSGPVTNLVAIACDFSEGSDLSKYVVTSTSGVLKTDSVAIYQDRAMQFQWYMVNTGKELVSGYDTNEDGHFDTVFLDRSMAGKGVVELQSAGPGKPYVIQSRGKTKILLDSDRIPQRWRERCEKIRQALAGQP
jgi:S1-C subfamily serine protease